MSTAKLEACWKCALVSTLILVATVATLLIVLRLSHDPRIVAGLAATASLLLCLTSAHVLMFILRSKAAKREIAENPRLAVSPKQPCCGQGAVNGPTTPNISPLTTSLPNARSTDATQQKLQTEAYRARVFSHDRGDFRSIRHSNVLIYWPHGFGDWVQLAYILPLFEPSNRYWITRFGDDNTSVMDCHDIVIPVYLGLNSTHCGDGQAFGIRHFGLLYDEIDGGERELRLPRSLYDVCATNHIDVIFWSGFPETAGFTLHPYHSKARNLLSHLVEPCRLSTLRLDQPLTSSISFNVSPSVTQWVESRLKNLAGFSGRTMCIIGRNGYTSVGKNWGHHWREDMPRGARREGEECRDFMRLMLRKDPRWMFLVIEDRSFGGDDTVRSEELHAFSYAELFGTPATSSLPFGLVMKVLTNLAHLCVGVPAAPYHLSMAKRGLPTVGIWIEHLPSWFDEPKAESRHLVSRNVRDCGFDRRVGSLSANAQLEFRSTWLDTRIISGEQVMGAVEELL